MSVSSVPSAPKLHKLRDLLTGSDGAIRCGSCTRKEEEVQVLVFLGLIALCERCIDHAEAALKEYRALAGGGGFDRAIIARDIEEGEIVAPSGDGASKELASGLASPGGPDSQPERATAEPTPSLPPLPRGKQTHPSIRGISEEARTLARRAVDRLLREKPLSRAEIEEWANRLASDVARLAD